MTQEEWLKYGFDHGFAGPPVCSTHDGSPVNAEQEAEFEDGGDPCVHVIRVYEDENDRVSVQATHSPTLGRAKDYGWLDEQR